MAFDPFVEAVKRKENSVNILRILTNESKAQASAGGV